MNLVQRFYIFQNERFPLRFLVLIILSLVLASSSVVKTKVALIQIITAFIIVIIFLFHIRVIDESRDFKIDAKLHPNRPVQRGIISIKQLTVVSMTGMLVALILAYMSNLQSILIAFVFVLFTLLAWKNFFTSSFFEDKPVLYHIINSPQMLLVQWIIYTVFTGSFLLDISMILYLVLIYNNIFLLEITRKVKGPKDDTMDTYSAQLGLSKIFIFQLVFILIGYIVFCFILVSVSQTSILFYLLGAFLSVFVLKIFLKFKRRPSKKLQKISELSAILFYIFINLLVYFSN